jgi:hypothetical protein
MTEPVTVEVEATLRMTRVEISAPYSPSGTVTGMSEILLREPPNPSKDAAIMKQRGLSPSPTMEDQKTYGVMMGGIISRPIVDVVEETVEVDFKVLTFQNVLDAMALFFERWKTEDAEAPVPTPMTVPPLEPPTGIPERVELTPMPTELRPPEHEVPPPQ